MNKNFHIKDINIKVINLLNKSSPYVIKDGKRFKRINENKYLKIRNNKIIVINTLDNKESIYQSVSEASRTLKISRKKKLHLY
jgi:hypothetical protein